NKFNSECLALQGIEKTELIDLLVRDSIFTLWNINTMESNDEELKFFSDVLNYFPKNSPILGYPYATGENEGKTVRLISEAGLYLIASDYSSNLAFCSHLSFGTEKYEQNRVWLESPPELEKKVYITFLISDGDNLQYVENRMLQIWNQKNSDDDIPVGWSISPLAFKYTPHLVDFYYNNASDSDYFIAGPSGAGYIYPDCMNLDDYELFLKLTKRYLKKMDLSEIWALGLTKPEKLSKMAEITGIQGIFEGYRDSFWDDVKYTNNEIPIFSTFKKGINASELTNCLKQIINFNSWRMPLFLPIWVHCWSQDFEFIRNVVEYCNENDLPVKFVRPDQFIYLYKLYNCSTCIPFYQIIGTIIIIALLALSAYLLRKNNRSKAFPEK
ncbi:MAG: hypothetical protein ACTSQJ_20170, partial [Promethearchaeota archaeon]